jgi:hypothetical protein
VALQQFHLWHQRRVVDDAVDAYIEWRDECGAVWDAYCFWKRAPAADAEPAFQSYWAALDREERAAAIYAAQMARVGALTETA